MKAIEPNHRCHSKFTGNSESPFPVLWVNAAIVDQAGLFPRTAKKLWVGVCGFTHRVFKLGADRGPGALEVVLVNDLYIVNGKCEEARRCLARQCPLNRTPESVIRKLLPRMNEKVNFRSLRALTSTRHCGFFEKDPKQGGMIFPASRHRPASRRPSS